MEITELRIGDRIRMKYYEGYAMGEITIIREIDCKVMFDADYDLPYTYYPKEEIELIKKEDNQ